MSAGKNVVEMSSAEQEHALEIARELAPEFKRVGAEADKKNAFPFELVSLYKDSGLVGLAVPKEYGGMGGDVWTTTRVSRELSRLGDPACALAFNMHQVMVGIFRGILPDDVKAKIFPEIAVQKKIVCGPFSEERAGFAGLADTTAVPNADGSWKINGRKFWGTLCEAADIVSFNATVTDDEGALPEDFREHAAKQMVFILPMTTPGIRIERTWDALGMRATGTHSVIFEDVVAPEEARVAEFIGLYGEFEWHTMTFCGVYQGLIDKAYEETREILKEKSLGATMEGADIVLKDIGHIQVGLGKMKVDQEVSARTIEMTCKMLLEGRDVDLDPQERIAWLDVPKVICTETAVWLTYDGMRLIGGSTFRRGHVLERLYRDSRSGPFHPLTTDQVYTHYGRFGLGLMEEPAEVEPAPAG
ncbi:MAG TPA: acyl-CoA dehydrogenase family protein [Solirubrobacteraceae bacterium]|jgi:alkylation response protein AidB-like acyl-CoA dehydrogenase|nr:acyl-CoA dehydrogenase family protein [Solirubrobacteraceae bacterium]